MAVCLAVIFIPEHPQILQAKLNWCSSLPIHIKALSYGAITVKMLFHTTHC